MEKELEKLGFTHDEARVYIVLLELGQTTAGPVVKKTGIHRQTVYDTIEKLKKKKLVYETIRSNRKNWDAAVPTRILDELKRKEMLAEQLLPSLLAKQDLSDKKQEVRVYEGAKNFVAAQHDALKDQSKDSVVYILGATPEYWITLMRGEKQLRTHERIRREKNISYQLLFSLKNKKAAEEMIHKYVSKSPEKQLREYRYLPQEYQNPTTIHVWEKHVSFIIFSNPIIVINIKNQDLANNFKIYFNLLWKLGKK